MAFAFCAADLLVELDASGRVSYAAGAVSALLGRRAEQLRGQEVIDLLPAMHKAAMGELLRAISEGRRQEPIVIRLDGPGGPSPPMLVVGYRLVDLPERTFLAFRLAGSALTGERPEDRTQSGLLNADSFATTAVARMQALKSQSRDGEEPQLTLVELGNVDELRARLDSGARGELDNSIAASLRVASVDGDSAGELGDGRYGIVHDRELDMGQLGARIEECARDADPEGVGVAVRSASVKLECTGMSETDAAKALVYTIHNFGQDSAGEMTVQSLSSGLAGMLDSTARQMAAVRSTIADDTFEVAFQPVVALPSRKPIHFEALVRLGATGIEMSPFEFIRFAEQVGLIADFDLAMCRRVIERIESPENRRRDICVAVNISGRSLDTPSFRRDLRALLGESSGLGPRLLFEITESMALSDLAETNRFIGELRKAGHKVCLDDFGVGAVAFEYLRALDIDIVKIDGSYVRQALTTSKGGFFLKAIAGLCSDLGITAVAEMVEEEKAVEFLIDCGIGYGQGYLFGRPNLDLEAFDMRPRRGVDLRQRVTAAPWA